MPFLLREAIQMRFYKRIQDMECGYRQNVGILGPSGVGKTKLLCDFFQSISRHPKLLPVFVRAESIDGTLLIQQWLGAVLSSVLLDQTLNIPKTLAGLSRDTEHIIPQTLALVKHVQKLIRQNKNTLAVRELFMLSSRLARETGKRVVLFIDEFQGLEKLPTADPFTLLGKQMMLDKDVLYVVTSSATDRAQEIFRDKLSLLFGNFEILELAPFGFSEMDQYLASRMPAHRLSLDLKKFLFFMTDGEPLYLDLLINRLESHEIQEFPQKVSTTVLLDALCQELFDRKGRIALLFEKRLEQCSHFAKGEGAYIRTVLALSHGRHKLIPIAAFIEESTSETQKILKRLVQEGLIIKSGSFYYIPDMLFRFWLREVFQKRHGLFLPEERILWKHLSGELKKSFDLSLKMDENDMSLRLEALLKEFRGDVVEIDHKKVPCQQFSEIIHRKLPYAVTSLMGRSTRGRWAFYLGLEAIDENAVEAIIADLKHLRKIKCRVLVALGGIDQNAKLIAQEAKMQLWDLRFLNQLFDLYDHPKIILAHEKGIYEPQPCSHEAPLGAVAENVSTGTAT